MSAPVFEAGQQLAEEQDYVQAYENIREKYKGNGTTCSSPTLCAQRAGDHRVMAE